MKKTFLLRLTLLMTLLFLTACGVPQKDYDKLASDLTAAQAQIQTLQRDLSAKESEFSAAKTQAQSLQSSLSAKESELQATKTKLTQSKSRLEVVNALLMPSLTGELYNWTDVQALTFFLGWMSKVQAVGDPTLTAKFGEIISTGFTDKSITAFFVYLLESITKALE
ncbi:MAG: hypothetical protein HY528_01960 [Chloroflexi bacterium]|nr:hypothetical protein [Chloroflexota bacterium]